jgi:FkbM family methyltransferase
MLRYIAQRALIMTVRPYVLAELPGWGPLYTSLIGTFRRERLWAGAGKVRSRNKLFGYETEHDLSLWADRQAYFLGRWYDLPTQLLALAVRGNTIVDIGANRGDFSLAVASMQPNARVIAFEPNPTIAAVLRGDLLNNGVSNVEVRECALGEKLDKLTLHVPFTNSGSASFGGFVAEGYKVEVPVRVGDEELRDFHADLIKIDVEGFELKTLRGLQKTIERCQPVIETELTEDNLARCGTSRSEVEQFMESLGYCGYGMALDRAGLHHELKLVNLGNTWDAVWLPDGVDPSQIKASTKGLSKR